MPSTTRRESRKGRPRRPSDEGKSEARRAHWVSVRTAARDTDQAPPSWAAATPPAIERGRPHGQDPAQETDEIGGLLRGDEPVDHLSGHRSVSRAEKAAAFRRTSSSSSSAPVTAAVPSQRSRRRGSPKLRRSRCSPRARALRRGATGRRRALSDSTSHSLEPHAPMALFLVANTNEYETMYGPTSGNRAQAPGVTRAITA